MSMNKTICYVVLYDDISKTTYTVLIFQFCTVLFRKKIFFFVVMLLYFVSLLCLFCKFFFLYMNKILPYQKKQNKFGYIYIVC